MLRGRPKTGNEEHIRIKLRKCIHSLWTKRKHAVYLKSNNELAHYLLNLPCAHDDTQQLKEMPVTHSMQL